MNYYKITFYNDMGHLMIFPSINQLPEDIFNFAYQKSKNKIFTATDKSNLGACYYILKYKLNSEWTYNYKNNIITLDYSKLDKFDDTRMKLIENHNKNKKGFDNI